MLVRPSFIVGVAAGIALSGALLLFRGSGVAPAFGTGANSGATAGTYVAQGAREVPTNVAQGPTRVAQVPSTVNAVDSSPDSAIPTPQLTPTPVIRVPVTSSPSPSPKVSVTPSPNVTVPTPTPALTLAPTPTPTAVPTPEPTPYDGPVVTLVISEVAWAGTSATPNGEWLELYNGSDTELDMEDYSLVWLKDDGEQVFLSLSGSISPGSYFLIERTTEGSPDPITDITGDLEMNFGPFKLNNTGAYIVVVRLTDGAIVDAVDFNREKNAWYGGESVGRFSMERIRLDRPGTPDNWGTNDGVTINGTDASGSPINGTPRSRNSLYVSG